MEEFLDSIDDYILLLDKCNKIKFYNKKLVEKLGYTNSSDIINKESFDKYIEEDILGLTSKDDSKVIFTFKVIKEEVNGIEVKFVVLREKTTRDYELKDLELILDSIPLLAWIKDINGRYIYVNRTYANKFGINRSDIIGKRDSQFWNKEESKLLIREDKNLIQTKGCLKEKQFLVLNNNKFWFDVFKSVALDSFGEVKYTFGMAKDITEKKYLEEKNKKLEHHIVMENLKSEFLANISHEFKTPLNLIIATIQLLNKYESYDLESDDTRLKRYFKILEKNSYRLLRVINNFIDITEIKSNHYEMNMKNNNIVYLIEKTVESAVNYVDNDKINIIFDTDEEEMIICCDADKIQRIILNLISNSIKAINGIGKILVRVHSIGNNIEILVKDDGIGIENDKISSIFEKFSKIDKSLTRSQEGSGLGLALVKALVDIHNGNILVNSEIGKGTEFIITLPFKKCGEYDYNFNETYEKNDYMELDKCIIEFSDIYCI